MRVCLRLLTVVVATGFGFAGGAGTANAAPAVDTAQIDSFLEAQLHRHRLPGIAVGVVDGDRVVHVRGFGAAVPTGRPIDGQTPFVLASVSKPVTATAVMQLVDGGKVQLDAPVQRYLPQFQLADPAASATITVRQLLEHTSGLPPSACQREVPSLELFVASLRTVTLDQPVGGRHEYCSGNYNVLGLMVQQVSGEPFSAYIQNHIFTPLDMRHSFTDQATARQHGLAIGHRWIFGLNRPMDSYNPSGLPSGYIISTAEDMTHFLIAQSNSGRYHGQQVLSPAAVRQMQQPAVDDGKGASYGLGWQQGTVGGVPAVYHYGANYNMETLAMIEPGSQRAAIMMINSQDLLATDAFRSIEGGLAQLLNGERPQAAPLAVPTLYGIVDTLLVALTALTLLPILRLRRWAQVTAPRRRQQEQGRRVVTRSSIETSAGLLLLTTVGLLTHQLGATWYEIALLIPDLVPWLWGISGVLIITGVAHAAIGRYVWRHGQTDQREPSAATPVRSTPLRTGHRSSAHHA